MINEFYFDNILIAIYNSYDSWRRVEAGTSLTSRVLKGQPKRDTRLNCIDVEGFPIFSLYWLKLKKS